MIRERPGCDIFGGGHRSSVKPVFALASSLGAVSGLASSACLSQCCLYSVRPAVADCFHTLPGQLSTWVVAVSGYISWGCQMVAGCWRRTDLRRV